MRQALRPEVICCQARLGAELTEPPCWRRRSFFHVALELGSDAPIYRFASREGLTPSPTCRDPARWFLNGDAAMVATKGS
jgi:hypothetical protein